MHETEIYNALAGHDVVFIVAGLGGGTGTGAVSVVAEICDRLGVMTFAIVIGEFTMAALLNRPAFGPYMQLLGANRAYEPAALAVIAFTITWGCLGLIQLVSRLQKSVQRPV